MSKPHLELSEIEADVLDAVSIFLFKEAGTQQAGLFVVRVRERLREVFLALKDTSNADDH